MRFARAAKEDPRLAKALESGTSFGTPNPYEVDMAERIVAMVPSVEKVRMVNYEGAYYMRTVQWENKNRITARLAGLLGCPADTLVITRNTTESLDTTGVPQAISSKTRRENMVGESCTELTLRNVL